ncbi:hypothetical protein DLE01_15700 [Streptomyces sp. FT05W]|nr:hypothetical protein DLE01_15700 [Streptomyces sp. FT05W]
MNGFTGQGGTQKEIAAAVHVAQATLSRYLGGERTAPVGFVVALEGFLARQGRPLEAGVRAELHELCALAHQASGSPAVQLAHLKEELVALQEHADQLDRLKDELAQVQAEKKVGKAELAALQEHADQLVASLHHALGKARDAEQERLALEERVAGQDRNLQYAQTYTRQLQAELTALQEQVVLIRQEVEVLRGQNKRLLEEHTASPSSGSREKTTVSGASTQATGAKKKGSPPPGDTTTGGGKKGKDRRQAPKRPRPANGPQEQTPQTGTQSTQDQERLVYTISWTGDEDPKTFSENKRESGGVVLSLTGLGFIVYALSHPEKGSAAVIYVVFGAIVALGIAMAEDMFPQNKMKSAMQARTLRLDHTGLNTSDPSGKQRIPWAAIKKISIHRTTTIYDRAPLALHVQLHTEATTEAERIYRPAGWPLAQDPPETCKRPVRTWSDEWVPVCVLGPLTGPDKTDLKNALVLYLREPPEGIW